MSRTHVGYDHDEGGTRGVNEEEKLVIDKVLKAWKNKGNKQWQFGQCADIITMSEDPVRVVGACLLAISMRLLFFEQPLTGDKIRKLHSDRLG